MTAADVMKHPSLEALSSIESRAAGAEGGPHDPLHDAAADQYVKVYLCHILPTAMLPQYGCP